MPKQKKDTQKKSEAWPHELLESLDYWFSIAESFAVIEAKYFVAMNKKKPKKISQKEAKLMISETKYLLTALGILYMHVHSYSPDCKNHPEWEENRKNFINLMLTQKDGKAIAHEGPLV